MTVLMGKLASFGPRRIFEKLIRNKALTAGSRQNSMPDRKCVTSGTHLAGDMIKEKPAASEYP